jgi:hypothetical protein
VRGIGVVPRTEHGPNVLLSLTCRGLSWAQTGCVWHRILSTTTCELDDIVEVQHTHAKNAGRSMDKCVAKKQTIIRLHQQLHSHMHMEVDVSLLYFPVLVLHIIK